MKNKSWLAVLFLVSACGGSHDVVANMCVTRSATYLVTFTEGAGGTCGQIPQAVINVNADGTIPNSSGVTCASAESTGCTTRKSGCGWAYQGISFASTSSVTFSQDGSSGTGVESISASGSASCTSTYALSFTRQ